jgi:hypothetical protein
MRHLLLLSAALLAAPCRAQVAVPEGLPEAVAGARAMGAARKAAAKAAAPSAGQRKSLDALIGRLIKDGAEARHPQGRLHAFQKAEATPRGQREVTVGLVEVPNAPGAGVLSDPGNGGGGPVYQDLVERHTYDHLEAQVMEITVNPDGKTAAVDSRIFVIGMDGRVLGEISQSGQGAVTGSEVSLDGAKLTTVRIAPAAAKPEWDRLLPELLKMGRIVEI